MVIDFVLPIKGVFPEKVQFLIRFRNISIPRPGDKIFVNKTAIKCYFGMKLEKIGMSPNCWDKSWDFQHFSWEIQRLGSSNTVAELVPHSLH